uniref:OmpA family protein n=1 Tax=Eiseniibacteriota bacterium TaxID=2212470 RepID=A0A832MM59_UNCEI
MRRSPVAARLILAIALAIPSTPAFAAPAGPYVDPKAPCFRWPAVDYDGDGVFDRVDNCPNTPKGCTVDRFGCTMDGDGDGVCDGLDKCPGTPVGAAVDADGCSESQLSARSTPPPAPPPAREVAKPSTSPPQPPKPVSEVERKLLETGRIRLENIYFETNSATLLPESETTLREVGETLEKFPDLQIEIGGHTDTRGRAAYNQSLSQRRAESVRAYLLQNFRLEERNLVAKGYGESQPETQERNDEELLRNRRVELKVLNPEALPKGVQIENR